MSTHNADQSVDKLEDAAKNGNIGLGTVAFLAEVNQAREEIADKNTLEQYEKEVSDRLKQDGLLPEVTLMWSRNLANGTNIANPNFLKNDGRILDKTFASYLSDNYDAIKQADGDYTGSVTTYDIDAKLKEYSQQRDLSAKNLDVVKTLLGNNSQLFNVLDIASRGGKNDGQIGKDDLNQFLQNNESSTAISAQTKNQIKALYENWDSAQGKQLREGGNGNITFESMAKALKYPSAFDMKAAIQGAQNDSKPAVTKGQNSADSSWVDVVYPPGGDTLHRRIELKNNRVVQWTERASDGTNITFVPNDKGEWGKLDPKTNTFSAQGITNPRVEADGTFKYDVDKDGKSITVSLKADGKSSEGAREYINGNQPTSPDEIQTIADRLRFNPLVLQKITDGKGNVSLEKLQSITSADLPDANQLKLVKDMAASFEALKSEKNQQTINLTEFLSKHGDRPASNDEMNRMSIALSNPLFVSKLADSSGFVTSQSISDAMQKSSDSKEKSLMKSMIECFRSLPTDGKSITIAQVSANYDRAKTLLSGSSPIFDTLDTAFSGGYRDETFNKYDLDAFLQQKTFDDLTGEQQATIKSIADNWQSPEINRLKDSFGQITKDSLAKGLGFVNADGNGNVAELSKAVNSQSVDFPKVKVTTPSPPVSTPYAPVPAAPSSLGDIKIIPELNPKAPSRISPVEKPTKAEMLKTILADPNALVAAAGRDGQIDSDEIKSTSQAIEDRINSQNLSGEDAASLRSYEEALKGLGEDGLIKLTDLGISWEPPAPAKLPVDQPPQLNEIDVSASDQMVLNKLNSAATVQAGDGYWQVAQRVLSINSSSPSNEQIQILSQALQKANASKMLHPNDNLLQTFNAAQQDSQTLQAFVAKLNDDQRVATLDAKRSAMTSAVTGKGTEQHVIPT